MHELENGLLLSEILESLLALQRPQYTYYLHHTAANVEHDPALQQ